MPTDTGLGDQGPLITGPLTGPPPAPAAAPAQVTTTVVSATVDSTTVSVTPTTPAPAAPTPATAPPQLHHWPHRTATPAMLLLLAGMFVSVWLLSPTSAWIAVVVCLLLFLAVVGKITGGRTVAALIDDRNLMSLSRAQAVAWTLLVLSGYFVMVLLRMKAGTPKPLEVAIDSKLWMLMGISITSLVGTPFLLSGKRQQEPSDQAIDKASVALRESPTQIDDNRQGTLYANHSPADARFTDMFEGEEVGNTAYIELAKIQMFLFTVIAAAAFASSLWHLFAHPATADLTQMPSLPEGLIALLGISHAGYLGNKTVDHTPLQ